VDQNGLQLSLPRDVYRTLDALLETALSLDENSEVDVLGTNPWGDLDRFRDRLYLPLMGQAPPPQPEPDSADLTVTGSELKTLQDVMVAIAELWSGGRPFVPLTATERAHVTDFRVRSTAE
jgi:hypothetical protein